ncbi:hypothetical protein [Larkinella rosea]|uniref:Uncharacterized protein n=1 Tax=Larkinella rosea TaxID=2025312 RepID=A0A3P1BUT4_9BACT|nr:hypothetical protein [Larkinella rosea]RRB04871.1 hypothetical protein EHT25_15535 [Larkinella rosea]
MAIKPSVKQVTVAALFLLTAWIVFDFTTDKRIDHRRFDAREVARLDAEMWRSYYDRRPIKLFFQLAEVMRSQYGAPFWRSFAIAYRAGKAAFVFKDGRNRTEYEQALPELERYFTYLNDLSKTPFDVPKVAKIELEWWIVRREKNRFTPTDWERLLAEEAALLYHLPADRFRNYARFRTEAMLYRDARNDQMTESEWLRVRQLLNQSWTAFYQAVQ